MTPGAGWMRGGVVIVCAGVYALIAWMSLRLALNQANASAVWPLAGLAMAILARTRLSYWPAVFLGALAVNGLVNVRAGGAWQTALLSAGGIAVGNTLEAVLGAVLIRRVLGRSLQLDSAQSVFRFTALAGFAPPALSAALGVLSLRVPGLLSAARAAPTLVTWFTGNVAGVVCTAPLVLLGPWRVVIARWTRRELLERVVVLLLLAFVGQTICGVYFAAGLHEWPKSYMAVPLVLWVACRFGRHETALFSLGLLGIGVAGTFRGYAAFPSSSPEQSLLSLQLFVSTLALVGLVVAASVRQVRLHELRLEEAVWEKSRRLVSVQQEKEVLTASAIHNLQSPLSGLRNLLGYVRDTPSTLAGAAGSALVAEMHGEVERMLATVSEALTIQRSGTGEPVPGKEAVACNLRELVKQVIAGETMYADSRNVEIRCRLPGSSGPITVPASPLAKILGNFLSNAVKFSPPGSTVWVTAETLGPRHRLSVEDAGPGILAHERRRIFSRGPYRGSSAPAVGESGAGVGLYLSGKLADQIGAVLSCEEAPNGGCVFSIHLGGEEVWSLGHLPSGI